jgi:plastocyanin
MRQMGFTTLAGASLFSALLVAARPTSAVEVAGVGEQGVGGPALLSGRVEVEITRDGYSRPALEIPPHTTITWVNSDTSGHTVTKDSGSVIDSPLLRPKEAYSYTFHRQGSFRYHDEVDPDLRGSIVVAEGAELPPGTLAADGRGPEPIAVLAPTPPLAPASLPMPAPPLVALPPYAPVLSSDAEPPTQPEPPGVSEVMSDLAAAVEDEQPRDTVSEPVTKPGTAAEPNAATGPTPPPWASALSEGPSAAGGTSRASLSGAGRLGSSWTMGTVPLLGAGGAFVTSALAFAGGYMRRE